MEQRLLRIHLGQARCAADLTDGSERGEYVPQAYILHKLGRPLRSINLMYCYYPYDKAFPARASEAYPSDDVSFQWDYPYDDYFPYTGGLIGDRDGKVFREMQEIRAFGQDVTLTLTCDPHVTDDHLIAIAEDLKPYGRVLLRLNHEATGDWFSFNKRASYEEVATFFVHASEVIRQHAPNVQTIICMGGIEDIDATEITMEREFAKTVPVADIWSVDKYLALHWGWPFDVALRGGDSFHRGKYRKIFTLTKRSYERFVELNGGIAKPMMMGELNADGDVTGPYGQCDMIDGFFNLVKAEEKPWLTAINFYQFRDRGRLGLEHEENGIGVEQPVLQTFRKWLHDDLVLPEIKICGEEKLPVTLRWKNSEDAEGIAIPLHLESNPHYCELNFSDDGNYLLELNGKWFRKSPDTRFVDLMPAFYEHPVTEPCDLTLKLFAPPRNGKNDLSAEDGLFVSYATLSELPKLRLEPEPVVMSRD